MQLQFFKTIVFHQFLGPNPEALKILSDRKYSSLEELFFPVLTPGLLQKNVKKV